VIFLAAHIVQTGWSVFYDGAAHVWSTPSDLLAALAVGLLAGLRGASRWTLIALPSAWVAGGVLGAQDPGGGMLPWASAVSVTLCGCLAAMDLALPRALLSALAAARRPPWLCGRSNPVPWSIGSHAREWSSPGGARHRGDGERARRHLARPLAAHRRASRRELDRSDRPLADRLAAARAFLTLSAPSRHAFNERDAWPPAERRNEPCDLRLSSSFTQ
jgi:hypothetical protein